MNKDYILGTHDEELQRLALQHRVWAGQAHELWSIGGITPSTKILDLGCGPGFASVDIAQIVGIEGQVIGVDKSEKFIHYALGNFKTTFPQTDFYVAEANHLPIDDGQFDCVYSRWLFSWLSDVNSVMEEVWRVLKPGGKFLFQEYIRWETFSVFPRERSIQAAIEACRSSWQAMDSEINSAERVLTSALKLGFEIAHAAPLQRLARPGSLLWNWPATFLNIYGKHLVEAGFLEEDVHRQCIIDLDKKQGSHQAFIITPMMLEAVLIKA
ncbi:MAG: hypothetical protein Kow0075_08730 [Salibacteraceae bacterium]